MFRLAGLSDPDARAARVLALETAIAETATSPSPTAKTSTKPTTPGTPPTSPPKPPASTGPSSSAPPASSKQTVFIVWQPSAFTGEAALVASQPIDAWKDLLAYHLIEAYAGVHLQSPRRRALRLLRQALTGAPEQRPRDFRGDVLVSSYPRRRRRPTLRQDATSPPKPRPRPKPSSPISSPPSASASKTSPGWPRPPRTKPSQNSAPSR